MKISWLRKSKENEIAQESRPDVGHVFLVEPGLPANVDVFLGLRLLDFPIVVCLHLDQRTEDVLVVVTVHVSQSNRCYRLLTKS